MAQVRTFKGSPPGAVIAKNDFFPAIFSQSVFFSVGVRSVRKKSRRPAKTLRELKFSSGIRVLIRPMEMTYHAMIRCQASAKLLNETGLGPLRAPCGANEPFIQIQP